LPYAYKLLYGRTPAPDEIRGARQFLETARKSLADTATPEWQRARTVWASLMRVLLAANEFLTLD
jgi:hypothetical protein